MGQSSLPVLNKTGLSTRWHQTWDDRDFYNIKFEEDIFLKIFFELILTEYVLKHNLFFFKKSILTLKNFYSIFNFGKVLNLNSLKNFYLTKINDELVIFYMMRFYIMRLDNVTIVILRLFFPVRRSKTNLPQLIKLKKKKRRYLQKLNNLLKYLRWGESEMFNLKNF